jgi:TolA-binding protein
MPTISSSTSDPVLETRFFWDRHRKEILAAIIVAVLALGSFGAYRYYTERRATAAAMRVAEAKTAADFQKVIDQYPETPAGSSAYLFLAEELRNQKKFADANATLQRFVDKNPKHELVGTARMAMAANLESLGKRDEALTTYQRLVAEDPKGFSAPIALLSEIHLLKEKNQIEEARRVCETILTQYRDSLVAGEASRQLKLLKGGATPTPGPQASAPPPAAAPNAPPAPLAQPPAAPPPAGNPPKPAGPPPKKP